ncbi:hypothetical protein SEPCBS119000_005320 [Sporothrix epigloea]|uniref:Fumarate reductase n=1 Tax=Sporothrix epigloea TaxID=1892477 RepID=A0ABP0DWY8_9PEZI
MGPTHPESCSVIVVGSGLAGLAAASAALRSNANRVILLERAIKPGGNSIKASSGMNGAPTRFQNQAHPDNAFFSDTLKSAGKRGTFSAVERDQRKRLIKLLTNESAAAVNFLADEIGVDLSVVTLLGGHSVARTHRGAGRTPPGADIVMKLLQSLKGDSRFDLRTGCEVTKLIQSARSCDANGPPEIVGVEYLSDNELTSLAGPVIFATGGFAGDTDNLLAKYRPDLAGLPSSNEPRPGMHGLLSNVGATLVDMDSVQIHPTGFVDPLSTSSALKFLAAEVLRGEGGILLHNGRRFVNEIDTREHVSRAIMDLEYTSDRPRQWSVQILLDPGACRAAAPYVSFYEQKGLMSRKKVSELDGTTKKTLKDVSMAAAKHNADLFGRSTFGSWALAGDQEDDQKEVSVGWVTPVTHFTMGGIAINEHCQVLASTLGASELIVPGLWAAGELTGGIHGDNRLGGSSLLECVVFGQIAGEQAAATCRK